MDALPPSQASRFITTRLTVSAPLLGFRDELRAIELGKSYLDFDARDGRKLTHWRAYASWARIVQDADHPTIYHIDPSFIVRRYKNDSEGLPISGHLFVNTEVTVMGAPAGVLTIWVYGS